MSGIDQDTRAAAAFWREVRKFVVSRRVYGRRDEYLAVMAASGIDSVDQALPQKRVALPDEGELNRIKRKTGFESRSDYRENFAPTWAE